MAVADSTSSSSDIDVQGPCLCVLYILVSAALINFNKFMMNPARFPFAMMLTTVHMTVSFACGLVLYLFMPSLFPTMEKAKENKMKILQYFTPLGLLFAVGVVASNQAYFYAGVAFLQFMKQSNVAIVFGLSCLAGSQVCDRQKLFGIVWIISGCMLAVTGEIHFVLLGFLIQALSQLSECCKNVMQEWILSGSDLKLDPLTYNVFIAPVCLAILCVGNLFTWDSKIPQAMVEMWPYLLPNALVAFTLNVTIAMLIKKTSAMGFILSGVVKDIVIVCFSTWIFGDSLVAQQLIGFAFATAGILYWSMLRVQPSHWLVTSIAWLLGSASNQSEKEPLNPAAKV